MANELHVWAVVDANGELLYSSNSREAVVADYEARIARDERLRRVLQIEERTLTIHSRHEEPHPGELQTVCVLPWLPLDEPVRMGPLIFDQWSEVRQLVNDPARSSADRLLAGFVDVRGAPIDPAVCFFSDRSPTARLDESEMAFVRAHTLLLTLAGIAEATYMHHAFEPFNAAHGRRLFLNFEAARGQIRIVRRRREGWGQSPWRSSALKLTKPLAAAGRPTAAGQHPTMTLYRQQFVDSLAACVDAPDPVSAAVLQSVTPFLRANDMDEYGSSEEDLVWLVTALEQLTGRALERQVGRRGAELPTVVGDLFSDFWSIQEARLCRRWLNDLRRQRNELHGEPAGVARWRTWAHTLLATEIYVLSVKALLARSQRYVLDGIDGSKIEALPMRITLVEGDRPFDEQTLGEAWHQTQLDAARRRVERSHTGQAPE